MQALGRQQAQYRAAHEHAMFENYLEVITSVHKDGWGPFDWRQIASNPAPAPPSFLPRHEHAAHQVAASYQAGLTDRLLGRDEDRRRELHAHVEAARGRDAFEYQAAMEQYRVAYESWQWFSNVARGVLQGDVTAYRAVLDYLAPFSDLLELGTAISLVDAQPAALAFSCIVRDADIVPNEEVKLTPAGKASHKPMVKSRYWELYQQHVCGCAIRVARDAFALLPVTRVVVNAGTPKLDARTGHMVDVTILAASVLRDAFQRINVEAADPAQAITNFDHHLKFKKASGFDPVEPITLADQFLYAAAPRHAR